MTVGELKELLDSFPSESEIVVCPDGSWGYAYSISTMRNGELAAFWGADRSVIRILCDEQIGKASS